LALKFLPTDRRYTVAFVSISRFYNTGIDMKPNEWSKAVIARDGKCVDWGFEAVTRPPSETESPVPGVEV
jgi:hypothetical protein